MYFLLILTFSLPSKTISIDITATRLQPIIHAFDNEHLFINYSSSFEGEIETDSDIRFKSSLSHNYAIIDNKVETNICQRNLDNIWVEVDGVESEHFSYIPFTDDIIKASVQKRICSEGPNQVRLDFEGLKAESIQYDACLNHVLFRELNTNNNIGQKIQKGSPVVEVPETLFRVCVQMKTLAPVIIVNQGNLKNCSNYKPLEQVQDQESNNLGLLIPGVLSLLIILVIGAIILFVKMKKKPTNIEIDQNPEYGQQEYYYDDQQKRTNIVEENEEYYGGGAYATDKECYVKDSNNAYSD